MKKEAITKSSIGDTNNSSLSSFSIDVEHLNLLNFLFNETSKQLFQEIVLSISSKRYCEILIGFDSEFQIETYRLKEKAVSFQSSARISDYLKSKDGRVCIHLEGDEKKCSGYREYKFRRARPSSCK